MHRALLIARVPNLYLALMLVAWFGYQVWLGFAALQQPPRPLDCEIVGPYTLICSLVGK